MLQLGKEGRCCPHCGMGVILDPSVDILTATCPNRGCGRPLHVGDAAADAAFAALQEQHRWKPCPSCGFVVHKVAGCDRMTCRWVEEVAPRGPGPCVVTVS